MSRVPSGGSTDERVGHGAKEDRRGERDEGEDGGQRRQGHGACTLHRCLDHGVVVVQAIGLVVS